jgi:hypothetical protein
MPRRLIHLVAAVLAFGLATAARAADYTATGPEASAPAFAAKLKPGDTVSITGGAFAPVAWKTVYAAPGVTVRCQPGATLAGWQVLRDSAYVTVDGCNVVADAPGAAAMIGFGGGASSHLVFRNFTETGASADSQGRGAGVVGNGVTLENFKFSNVGSGLSLQGSNIVIRNGECSRSQMDCMATAGGAAISNITVEGFYAHDLVGSGLHHDVFQVLNGFDGLTLINVRYVRSETGDPAAPAIQFLFLSAGVSPFTNLTIRGNGCWGCSWQALHATGMKSGVIEDNFAQGDGVVSDNQLQTPALVTASTTGGIIRNNVAGSIQQVPATPDNTGNRTIANSKPGDRSAFDAWLHRNDAPADPRDAQIAALQAQLAAALARATRAESSLTAAGALAAQISALSTLQPAR